MTDQPKPAASANPRGAISAHFKWADLLCRCGCRAPDAVRANLRQLAAALEKIRERAGTPLLVTSGYRCAKRNAEVGGAVRSEHLRGIAADLHPLRKTPEELTAVIEAMEADGSIEPCGLGQYKRKTIVHFDIRAEHARWIK
jgi:uncharacterized protein YcbK (DUF882 family)